jgi:L-iditol 2-dehydrogenase
MIDINASRLEFARKIGIEKTLLVKGEDNTESITKQVIELLGDSPNITIECSGAELCLNVSISVTRDGGTVVMIGLNHNKVNVSLSSAACRELNLLGNRRYKNKFVLSINLNLKNLLTKFLE